jgi:hypothetical protein
MGKYLKRPFKEHMQPILVPWDSSLKKTSEDYYTVDY